MGLFKFPSLRRPKIPKGAIGASAIGAPGAAGFIQEPFTGAWQSNKSLTTRDGMLASSAVFACVDLISSDVSKLAVKYTKLLDNVWQDATAPRFTSVLNKPNEYQTRQQFFKAWVTSKLQYGNAYILLHRNSQGAVIGMEVLNARWVIPLVAPDGSVYYQCTVAPLQVEQLEYTVYPARDIIHDRGVTSWHPLIGMTPVAACSASALLAQSISSNSAAFFSNAARPSMFLSAPGAISDATAARLKASIESGYSGSSQGKVLVGGDDLKVTPLMMTSNDAQTVQQLQWTASDVARCFHVPGHKIGLDTGARTANSSAIYESMYYSDCLQYYLESIEQLLNAGLGVPDGAYIRFDTKGLMRMDEVAQHAANAQAIGAGYLTPNEARATVGLPPVKGGDTPYMQQQNYALSALAARDKLNPLAAQVQQAQAAASAAANAAQQGADGNTQGTTDANDDNGNGSDGGGD